MYIDILKFIIDQEAREVLSFIFSRVLIYDGFFFELYAFIILTSTILMCIVCIHCMYIYGECATMTRPKYLYDK